MIKKLYSAIIFTLLLGTIYAGSAPTWSSDIQCIVYSHCSACHNPAGIAPFSLLTYQDAYLNMYSMEADVSIGKMPPYLPNTNYQHYADMRTLLPQEIATIIAWVDSGGQQGDTANLLPTPTFTSGPLLTHPDLTARIPNFVVPNTGADLYQCFVITPNAQTTSNYIKTIEVIPGNTSAVHHVLVFEDTAYSLVQADSAAVANGSGGGYTDFGGTGSNTSKLIGAWVPGAGVDSMPAGMGINLAKGDRLILQIHYPLGSAGKLDSTRVNLQYTTTTPIRNVSVDPVLNYYSNITDGPLVIPADSIKTFHDEYTVPVNVTVLGIAPHAHLVCQQLKSFAVTPAGDTIHLIEIDNWDFHWQGSHFFQKPIEIPAGSKLHGMGVYNNTYNNPNGPRPITTVYAGEATADEMMLFFFWYLPYVSGDENIIIDTANHQAHYLGCVSAYVPDTTSATTGIAPIISGNSMVYPNPAQSILYYHSTDGLQMITVINIEGQTIRSITGPGTEGQIPLTDMTPGFYFVRLSSLDGTSQTLRFVKN